MDPRSRLPAVDRLLADAALEEAFRGLSRRTRVAVVRQVLAAARDRARRGGTAPGEGEIVRAVREACARLRRSRPRRVINATGVVLHTNLGRAPLGPDVLADLVQAARGYCDLEYDLGAGARGYRHDHVDDLLGLLFPGSAALVVNNNAAAVLLVLNTFARGKETVVSRGELIEIGGSFRIPEILERSGSVLREVGTTNRTHLRDYEAAIGPGTGLLLKVWPSNYRVVGFTRTVDLRELARLARARGVPLVADQGCGRLFRDSPGPASEPSVEQLLAEGADLVCFSGDKMLGGPQAGVLVGRPELVAACGKNPLARALRPGKLTLAALAAACRAHLSDDPGARLPAARMLSLGEEELARAARALAGRVRRALARAGAAGVAVRVIPGASRVGGGAAPEEDLPTRLVAVRPPDPPGEEGLLAALRGAEPPVVARARDGEVLLDPRTLLPGEAAEVAQALASCLAPARAGGN